VVDDGGLADPGLAYQNAGSAIQVAGERVQTVLAFGAGKQGGIADAAVILQCGC